MNQEIDKEYKIVSFEIDVSRYGIIEDFSSKRLYLVKKHWATPDFAVAVAFNSGEGWRSCPFSYEVSSKDIKQISVADFLKILDVLLKISE